MAPRQETVERAFAITMAFEGGAWDNVTGDDDGEGVSVGAFQQNMGQGSLQPMMLEFATNFPGRWLEVFGPIDGLTLRSVLERGMLGRKDLIRWVRQEWHTGPPGKRRLSSLWSGRLATMAKDPGYLAIQRDSAKPMLIATESWAHNFEWETERGFCLLFDFRVQNGSIGMGALHDFWGAVSGLPDDHDETDEMRLLVEIRSSRCRPRYVEDVKARKLCIVEGKGTVHGVPLDLETMFGLSDDPWEEPAPPSSSDAPAS